MSEKIAGLRSLCEEYACPCHFEMKTLKPERDKLRARCEELAKANVDVGALHLADEQSVRNLRVEVKKLEATIDLMLEAGEESLAAIEASTKALNEATVMKEKLSKSRCQVRDIREECAKIAEEYDGSHPDQGTFDGTGEQACDSGFEIAALIRKSSKGGSDE